MKAKCKTCDRSDVTLCTSGNCKWCASPTEIEATEALNSFIGGRSDLSLREGKVFDSERLASSPLFERRLF